MKNYLQKSKIAFIVKLLYFGAFFVLSNNLNAQCETKISDTDNDKRDYVCAESIITYQAVRSGLSLGSTISWSLSGGGTIIATSGLNSGTIATVTIQWDSLPGSGPYCLTLTETNGCTGSDKMLIYIEKQNLVMACNDLVLVALDNYCRDTITGDMILEAPLYPDESYTVTVFGTNGLPRPLPVVTLNDLGETLMVLVQHTCSGLACMGNIAVQDNLATMLSCRADTIKVECDESTEPENPNIGFPLVPGSVVQKIDENIYRASIPGDCGGVFDLVYTDIIETKACGGLYQFIIHRTWAAIDNSGNSWSCTEIIATKWGDFDTMKMPCNFDGINGRKYFQCYDPNPQPGQSIFWPYRDSIPGPEITGYPEFATCSNIQFLYEDVEIPVCGYNRKVLRQWIVLDWCTGRSRMCDQVLSFVDDNPPIFHLPPDTLKFNSDPQYCYGSACPLPDPIVDFECSDWTYEVVGYHFKGDGNCEPELSRNENLYKNSLGFYCIDKLPVDTPVCVIYKVTDECGKYSYGNMLIIIEDNQPPTAACHGHTVVTLGDGGKLYATSLDDKSWDNCGIEKLEIKRTTNRCGDIHDLYFGEYVNVCCADVGKDLMVILRATDYSGNFNECMGTVKVDDKERPVLTFCPPNFTINCDQNYVNSFIGGKPTASDNCGSFTITNVDVPVLNDCGIGYVTRNWTIKDKAGNESLGKCIQTITVTDGDPLTYGDVDWPDDITVTGCYPNVNIDESVTGIPVITNTACKKLGIAHTDVVIYDPPSGNHCVQIFRTFKIGDWCRPQMPYIEHTQIISVLDGGPPVFTYCPSDTTVLTGDACSAKVVISAMATDDCTKPEDLKYTYKVDKGNNGSFELTGSGRTVSTIYERGLNKIVFTVTDGCGNQATCTRYIRVKDSKPPTPVCIHKLTTSLGTMGMVTFKARHFNRASNDNCTPSNLGECGCETELRFSFSTDINDTLRTYTCDSLDNGVGQTFILNVWVWDLDNNKDYCIVELNLIDSKDVCQDVPDPLISVKGRISDEKDTGLDGFVIKGVGLLSNDEKTTMTGENGEYDLNSLGAYDMYEISPDRDDNPLDGLTTLDLVLIQKHILGIKKFDNPFSYIAADANNTKSVTAADLLELRKLILGIDDVLQINESWKFLKSDTEFDNPVQPWNYDFKYLTDSLYYGLDSLDFIAVKIGDINRSATVYNEISGLTFRNEPNTYFVVNNKEFSPNEEFPVAFKLEQAGNITGFQYTFEFDSDKLQFAGINNSATSISGSNINTLKANKGIITFSWNDGNGIELKEEDVLFAINMKAITKGTLDEVIQISSKITKSEIYDENLNISNLKLRFAGQNYDKLIVNQNSPNPFSDQTEISFDLPKDDIVKFRVFNNTGKSIISTQGHYSKGQNTITISKSDLSDQGVYFYELTNDESTILKKMVLIK